MAKAKKCKEVLTLEEKLEQALVADWEQPYKVPVNWSWCKLPDLCEYIRAGGDKPKVFSDEKTSTLTVPVVANGFTNDGIVGFTSEAVEKAGSITVSGRGTIGFSVIRDYPYFPIVRLIVIRPNRTVLAKYIKYAFDHFIEQGTGTSIPQLTVPMLKDKFIPVPPLAEQQRIVDRIERMFSKLDEVKENVQNVIDSFENRKSAILHKAFSGELTAKWRAENHISINEWSRTTIGNILKVSSGKGLTAKNMVSTGKIPVYGGNGITGYHNESNVSPDTIVIGRVGYYCGSVHYISEPAWVTDNALIVSFDKKTIYTRFLMYLLSYTNLRQNDSSTAQPVISGSKIYPISICMLPITEQKEMVRILDVLFAKEQQVKEKAEEVLERIEFIKKSILARAFRGELGTNNPDEESSIKLLKVVLSEDKDEKLVTKPKSKRVSIPGEIKAMLSNHLEKDIIKLFYKAESNEVSIDDIMSVSSNKFEVMDALKSLEEKKLVLKKANGIYKLAR